MATRRWRGGAGPVAQVTTLTPATVSVGSTFTVTINGKAVTYTATTTVVADVTAGLVEALQAATEFPEFQEVTWEDSATHVTATGDATAGVPFALTLTAGGAGTPSFNQSTTTSPTGPNWWDNAANWKEGSVPVTGDTEYYDEGPSVLYGVDANAVVLAARYVTKNFPAESAIGLPRLNPGGYPEYRDQRLKAGATMCVVETDARRLRFDFDTDAVALTVLDTGSPADGDVAALDVIGVNAASTANVIKGDAAFAGLSGETAQFASVRVAYRTQREGDARVLLGEGLTLATLEQTGGRVELRCAATTVTKEDGELERVGTGAVGTLVNMAGVVRDAGSGTITQLTNSGTYERVGLAALTVTDATLLGGGRTADEAGTVTWTNPPQLFRCSPPAGGDAQQDAARVHSFHFGTHRKITIADI